MLEERIGLIVNSIYVCGMAFSRTMPATNGKLAIIYHYVRMQVIITRKSRLSGSFSTVPEISLVAV